MNNKKEGNKWGKMEGEKMCGRKKWFYQIKSVLFYYPNLKQALLGRKGNWKSSDKKFTLFFYTTGMTPAEKPWTYLWACVVLKHQVRGLMTSKSIPNGSAFLSSFAALLLENSSLICRVSVPLSGNFGISHKLSTTWAFPMSSKWIPVWK